MALNRATRRKLGITEANALDEMSMIWGEIANVVTRLASLTGGVTLAVTLDNPPEGVPNDPIPLINFQPETAINPNDPATKEAIEHLIDMIAAGYNAQ